MNDAINIVSLIVNVLFWVLYLDLQRRVDAERRELHHQHAEDLDKLLERVSTEPRLEIAPAAPVHITPTEKPLYITDTPYHDENWNDFVGEQPEEPES